MSTTPQSQPPTFRPAFSLSDLIDGLLWPKLLRATALALRPDRIFIAVIAVLAIGLIASIPSPFGEHLSISEAWRLGVNNSRDFITGFDHTMLSPVVYTLNSLIACMFIPFYLVTNHIWEALLFGVPILIVLSICGTALARMAACEFAHGVIVQWPAAMGFSFARWVTSAVATLGPAILVSILVLIMAVCGTIFLRWSGLNVLGAVFYPIALILSSIIVFMAVGFALGWPLVLPAIAVEGSESGSGAGSAIDSLQRTYAYVPNSPLRLVVYLFILALQFAVAYTVLAALANAVIDVSASSTSLWLPPKSTDILSPMPLAESANWGDKAAHWIIGFWNEFPGVLVRAFAISYLFAGGAILYLLIRKLNDGQDETEIWVPTLIPGTQSPAPQAAAAPSAPDAPGAPS